MNNETTLAQQCYQQLQDDIIAGILKPGQKLKVELFKQRFSMGQSPIREALSRLASTGLVENMDNRGFYVAPVSEAIIRDTYATFTMIETNALTLALRHGDAEWEARIVAEFHKLSLLEEQAKAVSYEVWAQQNYNFHQALIAGCNSPMLIDIERNTYLRFDRYCRMAYHMDPHHASVNHDEIKKHDHKKLMEFALKRNIPEIIEAMEYHINGPLEDVIQLFKKNKLI